MPFSIWVDPASNLVAVQFSGTLTEQGITEAAEAIAAHPDARYGISILWDSTDVQELLLEMEYECQLVKAAARLRGVIGPHKDVILARRELEFFASELYRVHAMRKGWETVVVRSVEEALDTLGLKEHADSARAAGGPLS